MSAIERLIARTLPTGNLAKRSVICGDLNLPQAGWIDFPGGKQLEIFRNNYT